MDSITSGRVRMRYSLQPSYSAPPKSIGPRFFVWMAVPMAPSRTRIRFERASFNCSTLCFLSPIAKVILFQLLGWEDPHPYKIPFYVALYMNFKLKFDNGPQFASVRGSLKTPFKNKDFECPAKRRSKN